MKYSKYLVIIIFLLTGEQEPVFAQAKQLSAKMAHTAMTMWKDSLIMKEGVPVKWAYDEGVFLEGITALWQNTGDGRYFNFIKKSMDFFVTDSGNIKKYKFNDYTLDNIKNGRALFVLYKVTGKEKYYKALCRLREQLNTQPRTKEGGFWHKKIYPDQMWLDGAYMAEPFYAEYAQTFNQTEDFNDIAQQFILMDRHITDHATGLMYHGWDESKKQKWADSATGCSPTLWARAMGWYVMGLVDVLPYFPEDHPKRDTLIAILNRVSEALVKVQDKKSGAWYQVLDKPHGKGNYLESSASCMFVYAFAKGVRHGYLPPAYLRKATKGYNGIVKNFITTSTAGQTELTHIVGGTGLGGSPYRDGSYEYYLSEKVVSNDPKGIGPFLLACSEIELAETQETGKGKTIVLDNYFNNEHRKDISGKIMSYHYTWDDNANSGFSTLRHIAHKFGAKTTTLKTAPTAENLKNAAVYIITDPDTKQETPSPNYISDSDAVTITNWVKAGGILMLMSNDSANSEFEHFNKLASDFGITFNEDSKNRVQSDQFDMGTFIIPPGNRIFKEGRKVYIKEIATIHLEDPATPIYTNNGNVIMAMSRLGKGTVFAVGDPWFYNEYVDGRKLPTTFQNYEAAEDLIKWLLDSATTKQKK